MAFDGAFLKVTVDELKSAIDCHIDKIYQPSKDELVFLVRKKGFVKRLFISVRAGASRIHFTENKFENPQVPPNFCMLLRKHLSSAKIMDISQNNLERIAILTLSSRNEMGDIVVFKLICELIGNQSNIILTNENGKIIDAIKRSDVENAKRLILPNAQYIDPPSLDKLNPLSLNIDDYCKNLTEDISKELLNTLNGFSPLVCREIEHKAKESSLNITLNSVINSLKGNFSLYIVNNPDSTPLDFCFTEIKQYGNDYQNILYSSPSELLDDFYSAKDLQVRIRTSAKDIIKLVNNLIARTEKRLANRLEELKKCENREYLRICGELLKANIHSIENGSSFAEVINYYDEELKPLKIALNPALTPSKNADKYFKDYKKTYSAEQTLTKLTASDNEELEYFDSVLDAINRCSSLLELSEIKEELSIAGYIKSQGTKRKTESSSIATYESAEGYPIAVGKNNIQNDKITCKLASKGDLWFHTKNIPGSHVVVFSGGKEVSDETILKAALLAAKNSKAATASKVAVDYTPIKYVKKPSGAKPGMVIYTTNKTVFVNPAESE